MDPVPVAVLAWAAARASCRFALPRSLASRAASSGPNLAEQVGHTSYAATGTAMSSPRDVQSVQGVVMTSVGVVRAGTGLAARAAPPAAA